MATKQDYDNLQTLCSLARSYRIRGRGVKFDLQRAAKTLRNHLFPKPNPEPEPGRILGLRRGKVQRWLKDNFNTDWRVERSGEIAFTVKLGYRYNANKIELPVNWRCELLETSTGNTRAFLLRSTTLVERHNWGDVVVANYHDVGKGCELGSCYAVRPSKCKNWIKLRSLKGARNAAVKAITEQLDEL